MAGYIKVWTTLRNNDAFLSLNCIERGVYLQLLLLAKEQRDDGTVCTRNIHALSTDCALDWRTLDKVLTNLSRVCLSSFEKNENGVITITIPNYKHWQGLDVKRVLEKTRKNVTKILPLRPDQSIPDQSIYKEEIPFSGIISHLNELTGKTYRWQSEKTQEKIRARWHEGFRFDDFIWVNGVKAEEWLNTPQEIYLRPETLYGNKFEGYRQQRKIPRQYSEKTNKALAAAARYLQNEGFNETTGQAATGEITATTTSSIPQRDK